MRIRIRFESNARLARFRNVLLAAQQAPAYTRRLEEAGLATPRSAARLQSIEEALRRLPRLEIADLVSGAQAFLNPNAGPAPLLRLRWPLPSLPRTAVLMHRFEENGSLKVISGDPARELPAFCPEALAGPVATIVALARQVRDGQLVLPHLNHAVIVFTGIEQGTLDQATRDLLWETFQVPVFEQLLGIDGQMIAWECEAHRSLHLTAGAVLERDDDNTELLLTSLTDLHRPTLRLATGLSAGFEQGACACGRRGPRLAGLAAARPRASRQPVRSAQPAGACGELRVWQRAIELAEQVHHFSQGFPRNDTHQLRTGLRRTAISVASLLAEIQTKDQAVQQLALIVQAQTTLTEFETQVELAGRQDYLTAEQYRYLLDDLILLSEQLNARHKALSERAGTPIPATALRVQTKVAGLVA